MEQLPRVGYFSGEKPTPKGETDFKTWKSDVTWNLQNYPEYLSDQVFVLHSEEMPKNC